MQINSVQKMPTVLNEIHVWTCMNQVNVNIDEFGWVNVTDLLSSESWLQMLGLLDHIHAPARVCVHPN